MMDWEWEGSDDRERLYSQLNVQSPSGSHVIAFHARCDPSLLRVDVTEKA